MANIQVVSVDYGAYIGATHRPLIKLPGGLGGITILEANVTGMAAGTAVGLILCSMTDAGTPAIDGTVGAWPGTIVYAEGVALEATLSTAYVAAGKWLGLDQASGTAPANTVLAISYIEGK